MAPGSKAAVLYMCQGEELNSKGNTQNKMNIPQTVKKPILQFRLFKKKVRLQS